MKIFLVAMFLAIMQAPSPIPREAPNNPAGSGKHIQQDTKTDQNPATLPSVKNLTAPEENQNTGNQPSSTNAQEPIVIREPVTVSEVITWWYRFYVIFTGLLVIIAAIGAALALRTLRAIERQANVMEAQFQPRLYIDRVYATGLGENLQPIFFVKIANAGTNAAEKVAISLKVELRDSTVQYSHDQIMTVPANGSVECFIRSGFTLNFATWKGLDSNILLRVSGHVIWDNKTIDYCYKYNPWPFENRPTELPLFVPCDFDTAITGNVNVRLTGNVMTTSVGTVSVQAENTLPETPKEPNEGT
jgi:hypothetical protein